MSNKRIIKCGLIGIGSVGKTLLEILKQKKEKLAVDHNLEYSFLILGDSSGFVSSKIPFSTEDLINLKNEKKKLKDKFNIQTFDDAFNAVKDEIQLLFECSPVNFQQKGNPGLDISKKCLEKGIHVVLANKGPIVFGFQDLVDSAKKGNCKMLASASCGGGLPILNVAMRDFVLSEVEYFRGVFNSTTNFILASLDHGITFEKALKEAQDRGIAETDPSLDIEGYDTANKLLICCYMILRLKNISLKDFEISGITKITPEMIQEAKKKDQVYKLIASATRKKNEKSSFDFSVKPELVHKDDFLANVKGWEMGIEMKTDLFGVYSQKINEREPIPTSAAMLRDSIHILTNKV